VGGLGRGKGGVELIKGGRKKGEEEAGERKGGEEKKVEKKKRL